MSNTRPFELVDLSGGRLAIRVESGEVLCLALVRIKAGEEDTDAVAENARVLFERVLSELRATVEGHPPYAYMM
jgi:hypothetical protein